MIPNVGYRILGISNFCLNVCLFDVNSYLFLKISSSVLLL